MPGTVTPVDLTTVADDLVVFHDGHTVSRFDGLEPATTYSFFGREVTTLVRPPGQLLCRFATVNDLHFGETVCGKVGDSPDGPIQRALPGEPPYPDTMNRAAVAEIVAAQVDAVIVKGDLTNDGQPEEFAAFEAMYRGAFGDRLHVVRGNHDAYLGQHQLRRRPVDRAARPGRGAARHGHPHRDHRLAHHRPARLARRPRRRRRPTGDGARPPPAMDVERRHRPYEGHRSEGYFGLHPDASDGLDAVVHHQRRIIAYAAGHTHRHRVRHMSSGVPSIEVGCVKDFPGTWAEYRVYEGGVTQVVHRISEPAALAWSERCRHLYSDFGIDYESYALGQLEDRCCNIPLR